MLNNFKLLWKKQIRMTENFYAWGWKFWTKKAWTHCLVCSESLKQNPASHMLGNCWPPRRD